MEAIYTFVRSLHIATGILAFFVAPVALVAKKGGTIHIIWGKIFFWSMMVVALTAVPMTIYHPNLFLFLIAVFSVHLSLVGYRAAAVRKAPNQNTSKRIDSLINFASLGVYGLLICWGIYTIFSADDSSFGYISIIFGIIGLQFSISQLRALNKPADKMDWWFKHMQGMIGAYIAVVSAFSAVNLFFLPPVIRWLWPTLIGSIGLHFWVKYYKNKFNGVRTSNKVEDPV